MTREEIVQAARILIVDDEAASVRLLERVLQAAQVEVLERLAQTAEFHDGATGKHTQRVGELSARVAAALGLPEAETERLAGTHFDPAVVRAFRVLTSAPE